MSKRKGNEFGLCRCEQCRYGKRSFRKNIHRMRKRIRSYYKGGNKQPQKGIYTD